MSHKAHQVLKSKTFLWSLCRTRPINIGTRTNFMSWLTRMSDMLWEYLENMLLERERVRNYSRRSMKLSEMEERKRKPCHRVVPAQHQRHWRLLSDLTKKKQLLRAHLEKSFSRSGPAHFVCNWKCSFPHNLNISSRKEFLSLYINPRREWTQLSLCRLLE